MRSIACSRKAIETSARPFSASRCSRGCLRRFPDQVWVTTIVKDQRPLSSVVSFVFRDEVLPYYGGSVACGARVRRERLHVLGRHGARRGARFEDIRLRPQQDRHRLVSTSRNTGVSSRNRLAYQYQLVQSKELPNLSPTNPKFQLPDRSLEATAGWCDTARWDPRLRGDSRSSRQSLNQTANRLMCGVYGILDLGQRRSRDDTARAHGRSDGPSRSG